MLPDRFRPAFHELLANSEEGRVVGLDVLADAVASLGATHEEIDALIEALEAEGRTVGVAEEGRLEDALKEVLAAARALAPALGRKPTVPEIAARAGLSEARVRQALELARVLQR